MSTISDEAFLQNLALSCRSGSGVIRQDGTLQSISGFIRDLFNGISRKDHFNACLARLNSLSTTQYMDLSQHEKLDIYGRISNIAKKCGVAVPDRKIYLGSSRTFKEFIEGHPYSDEEKFKLFKSWMRSLSNEQAILRTKLEMEMSVTVKKIAMELDSKAFYLKDAASAKTLAKLLSNRNMLNESDLKLLREKIQAKTEKVIDWSDPNKLQYCLFNLLHTDGRSDLKKLLDSLYNLLITYKSVDLKQLFRLAKIVQDCSEDVPLSHWYHCSKEQSVEPILQSGKILVMSGCHEGAWVSPKPEEYYGRFGFAFSKVIEDPSITAMKLGIWRGLLSEIQFQEKGALTFIGCGRKDRKQQIREWVRQHKVKLRGRVFENDEKVEGVISFERMQLMQEKIAKYLANSHADANTWKLQIHEFDRFYGS